VTLIGLKCFAAFDRGAGTEWWRTAGQLVFGTDNLGHEIDRCVHNVCRQWSMVDSLSSANNRAGDFGILCVLSPPN